MRPEFDTWVSINSSRFRGPEFRQDGDPCVVVFGDSFTFGHGVQDQEAYPALVDALLDGVEVVNGGYVAGSSPDMYYAWLKDGGLDGRFDGVLIGFFLGNDVDRHPQIAWQEVDSIGLPTRIVNTKSHLVDNYLQSRTTPIGYRYPVLRNSHLFHLAGTVFRQLQAALREPQAEPPSIFDDPWSEATWEEVSRTQSVFDGIFALASDLGVPVGVVMIPTVQQARGDAPATAQEVFARFFDERSIPSLDLLASLAGRSDAYFEDDQHLNTLGHQIAARELAAWYPRSGLPRGWNVLTGAPPIEGKPCVRGASRTP